ncbi:MAG: dihydrofolate reductase family protein [Bdellovibrionota bacterium]
MTIRIVNVMASSLDGKISSYSLEADRYRLDSGFTSVEDKEFVREQIKQADAIIVGANSVRASKRLWEQKNKKGFYPKWFIYTNSGLEESLEFLNQVKIARYLVSKNPIENCCNAVNISYGENAPGRFLLEYLSSQNDIENVLLFGGGQINRIFYSENLVDALKITLCPKILASQSASNFVDPGLPAPVSLKLESSHASSNHVFLSYSVVKPES